MPKKRNPDQTNPFANPIQRRDALKKLGALAFVPALASIPGCETEDPDANGMTGGPATGGPGGASGGGASGGGSAGGATTGGGSATTGGGSTTGGAGAGGGGSTTGGAGAANSMVIGGICGGTTGNTGVGAWLIQ